MIHVKYFLQSAGRLTMMAIVGRICKGSPLLLKPLLRLMKLNANFTSVNLMKGTQVFHKQGLVSRTACRSCLNTEIFTHRLLIQELCTSLLLWHPRRILWRILSICYTRDLINNALILRMASSGMLRRVALVINDILEELSASIIRLPRIGELGTLAVNVDSYKSHTA
jgi:hypothetical protein